MINSSYINACNNSVSTASSHCAVIVVSQFFTSVHHYSELGRAAREEAERKAKLAAEGHQVFLEYSKQGLDAKQENEVSSCCFILYLIVIVIMSIMAITTIAIWHLFSIAILTSRWLDT